MECRPPSDVPSNKRKTITLRKQVPSWTGVPLLHEFSAYNIMSQLEKNKFSSMHASSVLETVPILEMELLMAVPHLKLNCTRLV